LIRSLKKYIVLRKNTIDVITLGCSKNLVDSEKLMRQLEANGYKVTARYRPSPRGNRCD